MNSTYNRPFLARQYIFCESDLTPQGLFIRERKWLKFKAKKFC